ncbi:hypothetical protein MLD38_007093 [Melastoma candidum]|uniref:Uncharacterized protein n=1 Tax=Melastoma candidum TaxID=119954 RepID=A0ACB9RPP6_9MYRT|nr:hypothetical protein MLD38_007093 [Melastoma candidum]
MKIYGHWKPGGTVFWQALTMALSDTGMSRLIPSMLALMAMHRQSATSRSTSPPSNAQQGLVGGVPMTTLTSPRTSAHAASFRVSMGHLAGVTGVGTGTAGVGHGVGLGLGGGGRVQVLQALETAERKSIERRKTAVETVLDAIRRMRGRVVLRW